MFAHWPHDLGEKPEACLPQSDTSKERWSRFLPSSLPRPDRRGSFAHAHNNLLLTSNALRIMTAMGKNLQKTDQLNVLLNNGNDSRTAMFGKAISFVGWQKYVFASDMSCCDAALSAAVCYK